MDIHDIVSAMVRQDETDRGVLGLGELRNMLDQFPRHLPITLNGKAPTSINSYRGYYEHLAIGTDKERQGERSEAIPKQRHDWTDADTQCVVLGSAGTVGDLIDALDLCDGATFEGYKGGDFTMRRSTLMFAAEWGDCGQGIVGASVEGGTVVLAVAVDE